MEISDLYIPVQFEKNVTPEEMLNAVKHQKEKEYLSPATFGYDLRDVAIPKMKLSDTLCDEVIAYATHMKKMDLFNKQYVVQPIQKLSLSSMVESYCLIANNQIIC